MKLGTLIRVLNVLLSNPIGNPPALPERLSKFDL